MPHYLTSPTLGASRAHLKMNGKGTHGLEAGSPCRAEKSVASKRGRSQHGPQRGEVVRTQTHCNASTGTSSSLFPTALPALHTPSPCRAATLMATAAPPDVTGTQVRHCASSTLPPSHRQQSAKGKEVAAVPQSAQIAEGHGHAENEKIQPVGDESSPNDPRNASTSDHTATPHCPMR